MEEVQSDFSLIHILIFILCLCIPFFLIIYWQILVKVFWYIVQGLGYFFKNILWGNIKRFSIWIYDEILVPFWGIVKSAAISFWDVMKKIWNATVNFFKETFNIGKKVFKVAKDVSVAAYNVGKDVAVEIYRIAGEVVSTGISIIQAIWNFIRDKWLLFWNALKNVGNSIINTFKSIGSFINSILEPIVNLF